MMGWLIFALLALLILLALGLLARVGKAAVMLVGAALCLAGVGYALQGSPDEPGAPVSAEEKPMRGDTLFASERKQFLSQFGDSGAALATADAFNRMGEDQVAVGLLRNAIIKRPKDVDLRIGYAHALLVLAQGNFTPAVQLAFDNAQSIAKADNPAPRYFRGLAQIETGDLAGGEKAWRDLYASLPADSRWREPLARRLGAFDMLRMRAAAGR